MTTRELAEKRVNWLEDAAPRRDVVLSSRVRLARNLDGRPFPHAAGTEQAAEVLELVTEAAGALDEGPLHPGGEDSPGAQWDLEELSAWERRILQERSLASPRLVAGIGPRGVKLAAGGHVHVMINEEDHLRIQTVEPGFQLERALAGVVDADRRLEPRLAFAATERHGYLTACPSNAGTGLRASVLLHLPGLVLSREMKRVHAAVGEMGMVARGAFGEGSRAIGDCLQLSNQRTLGLSEEDAVDALDRVTERVLQLELEARERLVEDIDRRRRLEDRVHRSRGVLGEARLLSVEQALACTSDVRFGKWLGRFEEIGHDVLNRFLVFAQPAHLGRAEERLPDPAEAEWRRARLAREWFGRS
ncbi:ATP--guanido phosphotransferase [bacterium]|nr:ATP--guanido phosphotransferase [bacterium]